MAVTLAPGADNFRRHLTGPGRTSDVQDAKGVQTGVGGIRDPAALGRLAPQRVQQFAGDQLTGRQDWHPRRVGGDQLRTDPPHRLAGWHGGQGAKNAVRGSITDCGARAQLSPVAAGRARPDPAAMAPPTTSTSRPTVYGVSAMVTVATIVSRSAISSGTPTAWDASSTRVPSAPVPARLSTSLAGSNRPGGKSPGPGAASPGQAAVSACRASATRLASRSSSSRPREASSARAPSMLARIAPAGLVVDVASKAVSSLPTGRYPSRASTSAAWL